MTSEEQETANYLVSEATGTCLSVLYGTTADAIVLGLARYRGDVGQQWYVQEEGRWEWGGDRSLCLAPDEKNLGVCLVPSVSGEVSWVLDSSNMMTYGGSLVLDVPKKIPRIRVTLYQAHGDVNQRWWLVSDLKSWAASIPAPDPPQVILDIHQSEAGLAQQDDHPCGGKPDYLISQDTHTLVTVLSGSGGSDAVVGLEPYNGSERQQWILRGGQLRWAQDQTLCLDPGPAEVNIPDAYTLTLAPCSPSVATWAMDEQGVLSLGSFALTVPLEEPREQVVFCMKHGNINQRWWWSSSFTAGHQYYPIPASDVNTYRREVVRDLLNKLSLTSEPLPYPRNVLHFPGRVTPTTQRVTATLTLDLTVLGQRENLRMTSPEDWQATDLYIPDGEVFQVVMPDSLTPEQAEQVKVRVGAHCDHLQPTSKNVTGHCFMRMPVVTEEFDLEPGINNIRSQFGGNLIFAFVDGTNFQEDIEVQNAVKAPHYILGKTSGEEWKQVQDRDVPHTVLETENVVLVVPSTAARTITDPVQLLRGYDRIIHLLNDLAGFSSLDPPPRGKQWLVEDSQITVGTAHAGFPIMFCQKYYELCSPDTPNDWVTWHEIGHNFQQIHWWSDAYGSESTVNLFSLYIQETVMGEDRLHKDQQYIKTAEAVDQGLTFEDANDWQKLVFLMEIKHAFPQSGWEMYRILNRTTRALSPEDAATLASTRQNQYDYVYEVLSKAVGADLLPHYQRWGLAVSEEAQVRIKELGLEETPADLAIRNPE